MHVHVNVSANVTAPGHMHSYSCAAGAGIACCDRLKRVRARDLAGMDLNRVETCWY